MCDKSAGLGRSGREGERRRKREKLAPAPQGRSDPVFNVLGAAASPRAFYPWWSRPLNVNIANFVNETVQLFISEH